jgi:Rad3-related DNA helicase
MPAARITGNASSSALRAPAEADIVIANHALVMVNAARGRETANRPTRYVFDEGHHLFDAADAMFSAALTGQEAIEIRRWVPAPNRARAEGGAGLPRGCPTSPAMTRKAAGRFPRPSMPPARCRATAGSSG